MFRSGALRISLWASLAFALGTMVVFAALHHFVANDIQRRNNAWLTGEAGVLADVAERTPKDKLYSRVIGEVAELASREVPARQRFLGNENDAVFFLQAAATGPARLWVGPGDGSAQLAAIRSATIAPDVPVDLQVKGSTVPFRVVSLRISDGTSIYLGLSEHDELQFLRKLRVRFFVLWFVIVALGFVIVFYTTWKMLSHVRRISDTASQIGQSDLGSRVPTSSRNDEIGQLARTLNHMLDRIESAVSQLHAITGALAHDLRSPLTAIRGKLETSLSVEASPLSTELVISAMDELDRLNDFLNMSLDVAEAKADALHLARVEIDLDALVRGLLALYEPSMAHRGLEVRLRSQGSLLIYADSGLFHRVVANLLDNELKHLPGAGLVCITLQEEKGCALLTIADDGPGFDMDIRQDIFERRIKGRASRGNGFGLAFIAAVIRAHGGDVAATNRHPCGAQLTLRVPLAQNANQTADHATRKRQDVAVAAGKNNFKQTSGTSLRRNAG